MKRPDTSGMRQRSPTLEQKVAYKTTDYQYRDTVGAYKSSSPVAVARKSATMFDIATPNFKKLSAQGHIINSPMYQTSENMTYPLADLNFNEPLNDGATHKSHALAHFLLPDALLSFDTKDHGLLQDNAITDAFADVSANEGNTLLWVGELKETVAMVFDIGKGAKTLYEKTKDQRKKWAKGQLSVEGQQKLTLQLLYGILPLEQQIADFMAGLFETKQAGSRHTARGFRLKTETDSRTHERLDHRSRDAQVDGYYSAPHHAFSSESLEIVVRAGVLYEIDIDDVPWLSVILDPKSVISTAYALARLSFVIDWFINVGGTLAAWSPSMGVNELSSWVTVEVNHTHMVKFVASDPGFYRGEGEYVRNVREKWRVPVSRKDLAVIPRLDINLDLDKILAMVLLFAKVKKTL